MPQAATALAATPAPSPEAASMALSQAESTTGKKLTGPEKALLFLVSIEESIATRILSNLNATDVATLRSTSEDLSEIDTGSIIDIHREFILIVQGGVPTSLRGSGAYLRRIAGKALGEGKIAEIWQEKRDAPGAVEQLSQLDTATLLPVLEREHPQTLAVIFSLFDAGRASELLAHFPVEVQAEVVRRTARLEGIPEAVVKEIEEQFTVELDALGNAERRPVNGIEAAAGLLKRMKQEVSEELIEEIASQDEVLADQVRKAMFTFEHLIRIDGRGIQQLLKEVQNDQLIIALKNASEDLQEKVFGNLSSRAAAALREELELMGPVRLAEVEAAQAEIIQAALALERDGRIQIAREGGGDYV